jgi:TonB family protein
MKKWLLTLVGLLLALSLCGQGVELGETMVESPRFNLEQTLVHKTGKKAPIYDYIQRRLDYPPDALFHNDEGVVVVRFIVEPTGEVSHLRVDNSVSPILDQCVMDLIQMTSGKWLPGKVNGRPTAMESKVVVNFDIKGELSHEDKARNHLIMAIRQYDLGLALSQNDLVNKRKANNRFKRALHQLNQAQKYSPDEIAVLNWQVNVLEKLGELTKLAEKKEQLQILIASVAVE